MDDDGQLTFFDEELINELDPLPLRRLSRRGDRDTSVEAALGQIKDSRPAALAVKEVMEGGAEMTDWEIWEACRLNGYKRSPDRVRHGRLRLEELDLVVDTGKRRLTPSNSTAIVWRWVG